jgi:hypothetical protein
VTPRTTHFKPRGSASPKCGAPRCRHPGDLDYLYASVRWTKVNCPECLKSCPYGYLKQTTPLATGASKSKETK